MKYICAHCGKSAEGHAGHINRARKRDARLFCSRPCFAQARRKGNKQPVRKIKAEPAMLIADAREWRQLREFPDYEISNDGRLRRATAGSNTKIGAHIRAGTGVRGYPQYGLTDRAGRRKYRTAHVLVAAEFLSPRPEGKPFILHRNDNRLDCRHTNLRWGTAKENTADARANNRLKLGADHPCARKPWTRPRGERHSSTKLTEAKVRAILLDGRTHREIAREYGVDDALIGRIKQGLVWKHITNPEYREMLDLGARSDA